MNSIPGRGRSAFLEFLAKRVKGRFVKTEALKQMVGFGVKTESVAHGAQTKHRYARCVEPDRRSGSSELPPWRIPQPIGDWYYACLGY